jgi:hypothetical protein
MTANELRIGNLILDEDSNIMYRVDLNFFHDLCSGGFLMDDLIPIPLTDEWLVKFGFENKTKTFVLNNISIKQQTKGYFFYLSIMIQYEQKGISRFAE